MDSSSDYFLKLIYVSIPVMCSRNCLDTLRKYDPRIVTLCATETRRNMLVDCLASRSMCLALAAW